MTGKYCNALLAIVLALQAGTMAHAAVFNVTSTADGGPGSLRQALADAGTNAEADTIDLSAIAGQTIVLVSGELSITNDEILLDGFGVTIDAQESSRILFIQDSDVSLNELTITRGAEDSGGGILAANSQLVLDRTDVSFNASTGVGGGIYAIGVDLELIDSIVAANTSDAGGGGVFSLGTGSFLMSRSRVLGNRVTGTRSGAVGPAALIDLEALASRGLGEGEGGGLVVLADLIEVQQSTIAGNQAATEAGGALFATIGIRGPQISSVVIDDSTIANNAAQSVGGFQAVADTTIRLNNSTVSGNVASDRYGGASMVVGPGGSLATFYSTIVGNVAGVEGGGLILGTQDATVSIASTVVSDNSAPIDPDVLLLPVPMPTAVIVRQSLIGVGPAFGTLSNDSTSQALTGLDPRLGALDDNGGLSLTHAPIIGSPLLDIILPGDIGCGTTVILDQRGQPRPDQGACDIGSVEGAIEPPVIPVAVPTMGPFGLAVLVAWLAGIAALRLGRRAALET